MADLQSIRAVIKSLREKDASIPIEWAHLLSDEIDRMEKIAGRWFCPFCGCTGCQINKALEEIELRKD